MSQQDDLLSARQCTIPSNLSISYSSEGGLHITHGAGAYLYDRSNKKYLDGVNNIAHVGHANQEVNQAMWKQMEKVNTNSRYLSTSLPSYTTKLLSLFPSPLSTTGKCFLVTSGSEANDLAMRLAMVWSRRKKKLNRPSALASNSSSAAAAAASSSSTLPTQPLNIFICLSHGYHGATSSVITISPYKYNSPGGIGRERNIIEVNVPTEDAFTEELQQKEIEKLRKEVSSAIEAGHNICAFFHETILSCGGQIFLPASFLHAIYEIVHDAGGLCVADEVQTGFGRVGTQWWSYETLSLQPDIITLGKSIGNGYPLAAVVCTQEVVQAFEQTGMEYFNSCGATNLACVVGLEVIHVIERNNLLSHAHQVGQFFLYQFEQLMNGYPQIIYDVRGKGLFLGVEVETERMEERRRRRIPAALPQELQTLADNIKLPHITLDQYPRQALVPLFSAAASDSSSSSSVTRPPRYSSGSVATWISTSLMLLSPHGILISTDGPRHNVLKIKPPMVFSAEDVMYCVKGMSVCLDAMVKMYPALRRKDQHSEPEEKLRSKL